MLLSQIVVSRGCRMFLLLFDRLESCCLIEPGLLRFLCPKKATLFLKFSSWFHSESHNYKTKNSWWRRSDIDNHLLIYCLIVVIFLAVQRNLLWLLLFWIKFKKKMESWRENRSYYFGFDSHGLLAAQALLKPWQISTTYLLSRRRRRRRSGEATERRQLVAFLCHRCIGFKLRRTVQVSCSWLSVAAWTHKQEANLALTCKGMLVCNRVCVCRAGIHQAGKQAGTVKIGRLTVSKRWRGKPFFLTPTTDIYNIYKRIGELSNCQSLSLLPFKALLASTHAFKNSTRALALAQLQEATRCRRAGMQ